MIALDERGRHEEVWLLLPWLANGRLSPAEREMAEDHVRRCEDASGSSPSRISCAAPSQSRTG